MYWITGLCFRNLSSNTVRQLHTLPKLPYDYNALEPIISKEIMELHHGKHHATYVKNLNAAEEKLKVAIDRNDTASIVALQNAISFNGGGHLNHSIYWKNLSPNGGEPSSVLKNAISKTFGTFDKFRKELSEQSIAIQGSGWGWLGFCPKTKQLKITTSQNQDSLLTSTGVIPLLTIDVWEHAYYLQYKNVRADYVNQIFDIVNWEDVSSRYEDAIGIRC